MLGCRLENAARIYQMGIVIFSAQFIDDGIDGLRRAKTKRILVLGPGKIGPGPDEIAVGPVPRRLRLV